MHEKIVVTTSSEETWRIGRELADSLKKGDVVALAGLLGAGKTVMVKGICDGLGYSGVVSSPTFNLINVYSGKSEIYHFDCYRLESVSELEDIGYEEYFYSGNGISLVEWADKVKTAIPEDAVHIELEIVSEFERSIRISRR